MNIHNTDQTTFGDRLKLAREAARYTRPTLAKETGIPEKSLEKFEYGTMAPNIDRVQKLCSVLDVSVADLVEGREEESKVIDEGSEIEKQGSELDQIFVKLDRYREEGFEKYWRSVPQLMTKLSGLLNGTGFKDLLDIAENRALFIINTDEVTAIENAEGEAQTEQITEIIERIIDTAYFGVDLYTLRENKLSDLADELGIGSDKSTFFSSWSGYKVLVMALRPACRDLALKGKSPDFMDQDKYKKREVA